MFLLVAGLDGTIVYLSKSVHQHLGLFQVQEWSTDTGMERGRVLMDRLRVLSFCIIQILKFFQFYINFSLLVCAGTRKCCLRK